MSPSSFNVPPARFASPFGRADRAVEKALDPVQECRVAERPADRLGGAQSEKRFGFGASRRGLDEIRESPDPIQKRRNRDQPVILARQMRPQARPPPILGTADEPGADWVQADVAGCGGKMRFVQGHRSEARLEQMSGLARAGIDEARVAPMRLAERAGESVGMRRHEDQMHVVGHQTIGPAGNPGLAASFRQQVAVQRVIVIAEEDALAPVSPLRDVVRNAGNHDAGEAGHVRS